MKGYACWLCLVCTCEYDTRKQTGLTHNGGLFLRHRLAPWGFQMTLSMKFRPCAMTEAADALRTQA